MNITVVGSGIIGLTSAIALAKEGHRVRVIAKEPFQKSLSHKVGAIWFPFEVHPIQTAIQWGAETYAYYQNDQVKGNGISFIPFTVVTTPESNKDWIQHMPEGTIRKAKEQELPIGAKEAYIALVPLAEPHFYLPYLFDQAIELGVTFLIKTVESLQELANLDDRVINCTGLGAKSICQDDSLQPMRGQILRCSTLPNHVSAVNSTSAGKLSYLICRSEDCIIGGTDYLEDWNRNIDPNDTDAILERITESGIAKIEPQILEEVVGLRPRRTEVRFEFDNDYPNIFHNYGHGGAGFTVCWGCALDINEKLGIRNIVKRIK